MHPICLRPVSTLIARPHQFTPTFYSTLALENDWFTNLTQVASYSAATLLCHASAYPETVYLRLSACKLCLQVVTKSANLSSLLVRRLILIPITTKINEGSSCKGSHRISRNILRGTHSPTTDHPGPYKINRQSSLRESKKVQKSSSGT